MHSDKHLFLHHAILESANLGILGQEGVLGESRDNVARTRETRQLIADRLT